MNSFLPLSPKAGMLASVTNPEEAVTAMTGGADIIDLKNPARGALGALDHQQVKNILQQVAGAVPVSATIGDLVDMKPSLLEDKICRMAETRVDFVKVGFFPSQTIPACVEAAARIAEQGIKIVAVLFADLGFNTVRHSDLAAAGFAGVMLDTATKGQGSLRHYVDTEHLAAFIAEARHHQLMSGLAGSLQIVDIPDLMELGPDYLGFRGALCTSGLRTATIDTTALARVREAMNRKELQLSADTKRATWAVAALTRPSRRYPPSSTDTSRPPA